MNTDNITFRKAARKDIPFISLSRILVDAAGASEVNIPVNKLPEYPDTYQYIEGFPKGQDVGIIAETENKQPVGLYRKQNWVEDGIFEEYIMMSRKL